MTRASGGASRDPEERLKTFIRKFTPDHQAVIRAARKKLRKRFPTATELAYDNYNFFVIGFGPNERPSDCIITIAAAANGVGLCFVRDASLPDPDKVLLGSGKQTRFLRLPSADVLDQPPVKALLAAEAARAQTLLPATGHGSLVIRSVSAKQRAQAAEDLTSGVPGQLRSDVRHGRLVDLRRLHSLVTSQSNLTRRLSRLSGNSKGEMIG